MVGLEGVVLPKGAAVSVPLSRLVISTTLCYTIKARPYILTIITRDHIKMDSIPVIVLHDQTSCLPPIRVRVMQPLILRLISL